MNARALSYAVFGLAAITPLTGALLSGFEGKEGMPTAAYVHLALAGLITVCALALAFILRNERTKARALSILVLVLLTIQGYTGGSGMAALTPSMAVVHAVVAALVVGASAVIPEMLSPGDQGIQLEHGKMVGAISNWLPSLTFLQIIFGAMYRHKIWGVLPHMAGALVVALLSLIVSALVMQHAPEGTRLRSSGVQTLSAVLMQLTLGIAAFVMRLLEADSTTTFTIVAALHVTTGSVVFFSVCVLAFRAQKIAFGESQ